MTILLCDAGGTHARFAISKDGQQIEDPQKIKISDFPDFSSIASHFLNSQNVKVQDITEFRLSLGDRNTWNITQEKIAQCMTRAHLIKINDFEANAYGIAYATNDQFVLLNRPTGTASKGTSKCVMGVGTGLGHAYIIDTKSGPYIQRSHGAHMIPATLNQSQVELYQSLQKFKQDQTCPIYEDMLSGSGIWHMYQLACEAAHTHVEYTDTNDMLNRGRNDPLVQQILAVFHENLGIYAHQLTAFGFSYKGIYLTGGIIDRLVGNNLWDQGSFEKTFKQNNVPIVSADVEATPLYWVKDEYIALTGLLRI